MARNPDSPVAACREWHVVPAGYLRTRGVNTPVYRADSWEVDWSKRRGKQTWGRNTMSKMPTAREWHWIDFHTLSRNGIAWRPKRIAQARFQDSHGYWMLSPGGMTNEQIRIADESGLWGNAKRKARLRCAEHRLVAAMTYGPIPKGSVVRHLNGDKTDNRPENLAIGTYKENAWDHETARRMAMWWRNRAESLQIEVDRLTAIIEIGATASRDV